LAPGDFLLNAERGVERAVDALEAGDKTVAGILDDPAGIVGDQRLDDFGAQRHETHMGVRLMRVHQPPVTGYVRKQGRSKLALHSRSSPAPSLSGSRTLKGCLCNRLHAMFAEGAYGYACRRGLSV